NLEWIRQIKRSGMKTSNVNAKEALAVINDVYRRVAEGESIICPVLAYYGAGRAWLPSNQRHRKETESNGPARRWAAFYKCFSEEIRFAEITDWFKREAIQAGNRKG